MSRSRRTFRASALALAAGLGAALSLGCADEPDERASAIPERPQAAASPDVAAGGSTAADRTRAEFDVEARFAFVDHRPEVRVVAAEVEDVPMLIPSTIVVAEGTRSLQVRNDGAVDRTFALEGTDSPRETTIPAGQQKTVVLGDLEPGAIYAVTLRDATPAASGASALESEGAGSSAAGGAAATSELLDPTDPLADDPTASVEPAERTDRDAAAYATLIVLPTGRTVANARSASGP